MTNKNNKYMSKVKNALALILSSLYLFSYSVYAQRFEKWGLLIERGGDCTICTRDVLLFKSDTIKYTGGNNASRKGQWITKIQAEERDYILLFLEYLADKGSYSEKLGDDTPYLKAEYVLLDKEGNLKAGSIKCSAGLSGQCIVLEFIRQKLVERNMQKVD